MKLKTQENSINFEELKSKLKENFPQYEFRERKKNFLVVKKTSTIGTNIILKKNKLFVVGNFPTVVGQMIFSLSIFLLGILIPIIIYFAVFHTKLKSLERELGEFLKQEYKL